MQLPRLTRLAAVLLVLSSLLLPITTTLAQAGCDPNSLISPDICGFDSFSGSPPQQIPNGWTSFVLSGSLSFEQDHHNGPDSSNLRMWSDGGTFKAGLYRQVRVTPGAGYRASVAFGAPTSPDTFGRQLGLDPSGGVDPNAPTVIWGPAHWGVGRYLNYPAGQGPNIDVRARASGDLMTVFFVADHPRSTGRDEILVDGIMLLPDEAPPAPAPAANTPAPAAPAPTQPRIAPTRAVVAAAPTSTPTSTATLTPTPSVTPSPSPTATSSPSPTASATPTSTPTFTPSPSPTPSPTPTATPTPGLIARLAPHSFGRARSPGLDWLDVAGFTGLVMAAGLLIWLARRTY